MGKDDSFSWLLNPGEDLVINLDSRTAPNEIYFQYLENFMGRESMVFHTRKDNVFKFFDLDSGNLFHQLSYPTDGPESIRSAYGFYIHNEDSIFLSRQYHYQILLVDSNFRTINQYDLIPENIEFENSGYLPKTGQIIQTTNFNSRSLPFIWDGKLILPSMYMAYADKKTYTSNGRLYTIYDLNKRTFSYDLAFPEPLQEKVWGSLLTKSFGCLNPLTKKIITSYAGYDHISVSDSSLTKTEYYPATSDQFIPIRPFFRSFIDVEEEIDHYMNMPTFGGIYYDKYRDVYYRLGKFPKPQGYDPYKSDYSDLMANPRDLVIIVLDGHFQKLTEHTIRQSELGVYFENCFVNEKGFYIAYVDNSNEDKLIFKGFVLEKDEK